MDELISVEGVAEGLWQTITGIDGEAHQAWRALPEAEKQPWREHAKVAIANWHKWMGPGSATGIARGGGEGGATLLEKLDGDPRGRLAEGVRDRETIVLCGLPMWERIELVETLAKWIPENRRVIVLEDRETSDPKLREDGLPQNHIVLYYNIPGVNGVALEDMAKTAANMAGDYLIVPNLRYSDLGVFHRHIAHVFGGLIVAVNAFEKDEAVRSIADVLIEIVSDKSAPLGIGSVWMRPPSPSSGVLRP